MGNGRSKQHFTYSRLVWFSRMMEGLLEPTAFWAGIVLLIYPNGLPSWVLHLLPLAFMLLRLDELLFVLAQPKSVAIEDGKVTLVWLDRQAILDAGQVHGELYRSPKRWNRPMLALVTPQGHFFFFRGLQHADELVRILERSGARIERLGD